MAPPGLGRSFNTDCFDCHCRFRRARCDQPWKHGKQRVTSKEPSPMGVGIEVKELNAWFGKSQVLHEIDIKVGANAVTAVIGPSGCGKSTFVRCLNRMHETIPDARVSGSVRIGDLSVYNGTSATQLRRR